MRMLVSAIALLIAAPVAAQTAPAANPHAGHSMAQHGQGHGDHQDHKDCCKDGKMDCCRSKTADGKAKECCAKTKAEAKAEPGHQGHAGH